MDSVAGRSGPAARVLSCGFHRFWATKPVSSETSQAERWSGANHGSIGDSWPIAFSGCPRGPRVDWETARPRHTAPSKPAETHSRTRASREPDGHRQRRFPRWSGFHQRHSSCLRFQILGVEARSFLPDMQGDRSNLPGQGQARHLRSHALGQQSPVELLERARLVRCQDGRTFE